MRAKQLQPAIAELSGEVTRPERWHDFNARVGDVILSTPAKSGTTWTQAIATMLLYGTVELPDTVTRLSPWIDVKFHPREANAAYIEALPGRRLIKTHASVEGFPVWEGVKTISVYRHPLECLLSLRKHVANFADRGDHALLQPPNDCVKYWLAELSEEENWDRDGLWRIIEHFTASTHSDRLPDHLNLSYAAMLRDHAGAVRALDEHLETGRDAALQAQIVEATTFKSMKAKAEKFAPEAGSGIWKAEKSFFASGKTGTWEEEISAENIARYKAQFERFLPDPELRSWIETGIGNIPNGAAI